MEKRAFLRHAAVYGAGNLLAQASGLVLLPLYTRHLSPAEYGVLEVIGRVGEVLVICLMARGLRQAIVVFYKQGRDEPQRRAVSGAAVTTASAMCIAGTALMAAAAEPLGSLIGIDSPNLLRLGALATFLEVLVLAPLALAQARQESGLFVAVSVSQGLIRIGLCIAFVVGLGWGLSGVLTATALSAGLYGVGLIAREWFAGNMSFDAKVLRSMVRFSLPFIPAGLGAMVLSSGDRFFLLRSAGHEQVGIYALGYRLATIVSTLTVAPLYMVWSVRMYDTADATDAAYVFGRAATRILAAYFMGALGLVLLQDELIGFLGGTRYTGAALVIAPVVLANAFLVWSTLMEAGLYIRHRTDLKPRIVLTSTLVILVLYALLIPPFAALGAAFATLLGYGFLACITWVITQKVFFIRYEIGRLVAMAATASFLWASSRMLPGGVWSIVAKFALWASWPIIMWSVGVVPRDDREGLHRAVRKGLSSLCHFARCPFRAEARCTSIQTGATCPNRR
jgi:O-antigen/teichoic acid export membrane protein